MVVTAEAVGQEDLGQLECMSSWRTEPGQLRPSFAEVTHFVMVRAIHVEPPEVLYWDGAYSRLNSLERFRYMLTNRAAPVMELPEYELTLQGALAMWDNDARVSIAAIRMRSLRRLAARYEEYLTACKRVPALRTANTSLYTRYLPPEGDDLRALRGYLLELTAER